ncbi:MAG: hypothetical protein U0Q16_37345 [Bryobacteraceae bacterium]
MSEQPTFATRLANHVRDHHGDCVVRVGNRVSIVRKLPDDALEKLVAAGMKRAISHGLEAESSIAGFVGAMFRFAPNFDQSEQVRRVLGDTVGTAEERWERVLSEVGEEEWEGIRRRYDWDAWDG